MIDSLSPEAVEPLLTGRLGRPYRYEPVCESTQLLVDSTAAEGAVAVCDEQTHGRGRSGGSWQAPPGAAILCSTVLRPPPDRPMPELSLVAGMAAADAVEETLGLTAQIKWPNDVMVNRRKVAGILAEARDGAVVLGVGINVNQARGELPPEPQVPAASMLTIDGVRRPRAPLLAALLARLEQQYDLWRAGGLEAIFHGLGARDFLRGRKVSVDGATGYAVGIDRTGCLEIDVEGERRRVRSGSVAYER